MTKDDQILRLCIGLNKKSKKKLVKLILKFLKEDK